MLDVSSNIAARQIVGDNIRCYRVKLHWTQLKLSTICGLNHDYIGRLERGLENIGVDNLLKVALALGVESHTLLIERYCFEH